uniref:Uncharacterized protein n=1 Tax=Noctiluca scintillans TaxID=2966 RepID=A0A7S1B069_NOCSC|mmetsp:Transcript_66295/g.175596  ORF Transcript_66295/g.175596 Transcript_66295/m.175596 type:complete len:271 (+) Transcript_66295:52-864(+)
MAAVPRRILVTGGNKGIGKALCKQLVDANYHVLLGSRDEERGLAAVGEIAEATHASDRIEFLRLDVCQESSVTSAAQFVVSKYGTESPLFAVVNNAGVGGNSMRDTLNVNLYGPKRVCDAFIPLLCPSTGRIVNTSSASGPMFVADASRELASTLVDPNLTWDVLDSLVNASLESSMNAYGFSKACLNAYTMILAREHPNLLINAMTPGFIDTDLTAGRGSTSPPEKGTKSAIHLLFADLEGNGRFYGSDAVRSPLDRYRNPGDPPYEGP